MKIAVVLFNLGGPDRRESISPFLYNFFTDRNIIGLPFPFRHMLAVLIAFRRSRKEAGNSYSILNWVSPLLSNTMAQAQALEAALNNGSQIIFKTFICMRYWHPMAMDVAREVKEWEPDKLVLLPLYPQYSTTTTRSSFQAWKKAAERTGLQKPASVICCYPFNEGFVGISADRIRPVYKLMEERAIRLGWKKPKLLFSAHGLPEKTIRSGDPYQWQCEESARRIARKLNMDDTDWQICYQSRVGPLKWIGPSTSEALKQAAVDKRPVVIYPHAFVSEHVETLVEIEIEYRHAATMLGVPDFARVETAGTGAAFICGLKDIVLSHLSKERTCAEGGPRICPSGMGRCCMADIDAWPA